MPILPPNSTLTLTPFTVAIPEQELADLQTLIAAAPAPPETYESVQTTTFYGPNHAWMKAALARWTAADGYSWRKTEKFVNTFPQYTTSVSVDGEDFSVHFVGLFSEKAEAQPVLALHGWPASYMELLDFAKEVVERAEKEGKPVHLVVPSMPGFAFSGKPPLHRDFSTFDSAKIMNALMVGLGFGAENGGYVTHGGDIGGITSRIIAAQYDDCKAVHVNFLWQRDGPAGELDDFEKAGMKNRKAFLETGNAYTLANANRPSTMGWVLSASPVALLAWLGQFFMPYTMVVGGDSMDKILESVTLWWLTQTYPSSIYHYRHLLGGNPAVMPVIKDKPAGFSSFPREVIFVPKSWVEVAFENLVYYKRHDQGGHFAAMEKPALLAEDLLEFLDVYHKQGGSKL